MPFSKAQADQADACMHALLQCIYRAPVLHNEERLDAFKLCQFNAAHCYAQVLEQDVPGCSAATAKATATDPFLNLPS